jgi:hypothetical protein
MKNGKSRLIWMKNKGYSLTFLQFLPLYEKWKKWLKMDEK